MLNNYTQNGNLGFLLVSLDRTDDPCWLTLPMSAGVLTVIALSMDAKKRWIFNGQFFEFILNYQSTFTQRQRGQF